MTKSLKLYAISTGGVVLLAGGLYAYIQYQKQLRRQAEEELLKLQLESQDKKLSMLKIGLGVGALSVLTYGVLYAKNAIVKKFSSS